MEDPDKIDALSLERIGPHEVIRCLLELFKSNGKAVEGSVPQDQDGGGDEQERPHTLLM